jgi:perosamine synthetase
LIPVNQPLLGNLERKFVCDALESGWISGSGPYVDRFEKQWAAYCGRQHGIAVSSGTAALDTAFHALNLPPGSEIIMPTFTIISCAQAAVAHRLTPVYIDADPRTWCMDTTQIEAAITPKTRAIMMVHIYGHPVDGNEVRRLADRYNLKIIEDAAEAHGATCRGRRCGSFGDISVFSFYANKLITTGEGGMVLCDDKDLAATCRSYGNLYFGRDTRFSHEKLGQNYRFNNLLAALGCAQLQRLDQFLARKAEMARFYHRELSAISDLQLPLQEPWATNVYWVYGIVPGDSYPFDARDLSTRLRQHDVETRPFFLGMHEQPVFRTINPLPRGAFPVAERLSRRGLYLPSGLGTERRQMQQVVKALKICLQE